MDYDIIQKHIEAIIFTASKPVKQTDIQESIEKSFEQELKATLLHAILEKIEQKYDTADLPFSLRKIAGGYSFLTKSEYHKTISLFLQIKSKRKLSTAAMETLSIIAYKQPVTKTTVEVIRGVNCDYSVQKLLEKELIEIKGRSEGPGRPLIYGTSEQFMEYFGLGSVGDLPKLNEVVPQDNSIGEAEPDLEQDYTEPQQTESSIETVQ